MSSASIKEIGAYLIGNVASAGGNHTRTVVGSGENEFSSIFEKTNAVGTENKVNRAGKADAESIQNHANMQKKNAAEQLQEKQQLGEELAEEERILEAAEEAGQQLVEEVAKTFDLTVEDVEQVMETLGLVPLDLLQGENLTKLVLGLNPGADYLTIVTDEHLFADLKSLLNFAQELMNQMAQEFQMEEGQLNQLLAMAQEAEESNSLEGLLLQTQEPEPSVVVETEEPESVLDKGIRSEGNPAQESESVESVDQSANQSADHFGKEQNTGGKGAESFGANLLNQLSQAVENAAGTEASTYGVNGREIIDQVLEQIKVSIKADTTEMELQLHPASLGSLKVQLASKAGILTATFTAENEAVKAALEGQLIQLKENFEQQGIKVEAVEVNVEAKGFERGLDQQNQGSAEEQTEKKKSGRRINMRELEEGTDEGLDEELSEGDKIVADLMMRNGNRVDYTV